MFTSVTSYFAVGIAAVEKGAALVYHEIVALETDASTWEASHPTYTAIIDKGLAYATDLATRYGIPVDELKMTATDIVAALKELAAADGTLASSPLTAATAVVLPAMPAAV